MSAGNLRMGVVVDEGASDAQADAMERIFGGKEGGLFEEFAALTSDWLGAERASITFSDGEEPSATIGDINVNFEAFRDADGNLTTSSNAPVGLAPKFTLGKSSGSSGLSAIPSRRTTARRPNSSTRASRATGARRRVRGDAVAEVPAVKPQS